MINPFYAAVPLKHRQLLQIRQALSFADGFCIGQFDTFTVPKLVTDAIVNSPSNNHSAKPKYQSRAPFDYHAQPTDKGNRGMFQGSILDNRIKEHRCFGVRARIDGLIEDVPEMVVTSPLQNIELFQRDS